MDEKQLEERMLSFLRGEADVLVSTSIIESGIDIPQANTLIVERADIFGLAQLYQIRGRVGRSRERAYAYLLYPSAAALTEEAAKRLQRAQRLHRARRRLQDRDARPRDPRRRQPARRRAVRPRRRARLRALHADARRGRRAAMDGDADEDEPEPVRLDVNVDAYVPADYIPYEQAKVDVHRRDRRRARGRRARRCCATSSRTASARCPSRWRTSSRSSRRASSSARPARAPVTFRGGRLAVTPIELDSDAGRSSCASEIPERAATSPGAVAAVACACPTTPTQRFPAVVRAADALLAVTAPWPT